MRLETCVLAAVLVLAVPGFAENAAPPAKEQVLEKIQLVYQAPDEVVGLVMGADTSGKNGQPAAGGQARTVSMPPGVTGLVGYPLDHTLLVRGTPEALKAFREAVVVVDVKVEAVKPGEDRVRTAVTPRHARSAELQQKMRALPDAGSVTEQGGRLVLEGKAAWIRAALHAAFEAELPTVATPKP